MSPRLKRKLSYRNFKRNKLSFAAVFLVFSLIVQTLAPLIQHRPGYLKSVEASEADEEDQHEGVFDSVPQAFEAPYVLPDSAETIDDLIQGTRTAALSLLQVETTASERDGDSYAVNVSSDGGFAKLNDQTLLIFDKNSFVDDVTIKIEPVYIEPATPITPTTPITTTDPAHTVWLPVVIGSVPAGFVNQSTAQAREAGSVQQPSIAQDDGQPINELDAEQNALEAAFAAEQAAKLQADEIEAELPEDDVPLAGSLPADDIPQEENAPLVITDVVRSEAVDPNATVVAVEPPPDRSDERGVSADLLGALDRSAETLAEFEFDIINSTTGQPITTTNHSFIVAIDLSGFMDDAPSVWSVQLRHPDDLAGVHAYGVTELNENGLIASSITTNAEASNDLTLSVVRAGTAQAGRNGRSSADVAPWVPTFNAPTVSEFSGSASYQYPIELPPGRAGLAPNIDISYSSASLRGQTINKHNDQGPLGIGWSLNQIEIVRNHADIDQWSATALHTDAFSLVFNGQSQPLLPVDSGTTNSIRKYQVLNNPSMRVEMLYSGSAPNADGIYWEVTGPDGTVYRLGYTGGAEATHRTQAVTNQQSEFSMPTWQGRNNKISAYKWLVDTVTDVHGNRIQYEYHKFDLRREYSTHNCPSYCGIDGRLPQSIYYNFAQLASSPDAPRFDVTNTNVKKATAVEFRISNFTPTNEDVYRFVHKIDIYHLGTRLRSFNIGHSSYVRDNNLNDCGTAGSQHNNEHPTYVFNAPSVSMKVNSITPVVYGSSATAPAALFDYALLRHGDASHSACFAFYYLSGVRSELGAYTRFVYATDNRAQTIVDGVLNGSHWRYVGFNVQQTIAKSWYVREVRQYDGVRGWWNRSNNSGYGQYGRTIYYASSPCYDFGGSGSLGSGMSNAVVCKASRASKHSQFKYGVGKLLGFGVVDVRMYDYDGKVIGRNITNFHRTGYDANNFNIAYANYDGLINQGRPSQVRAYGFNQTSNVYFLHNKATYQYTAQDVENGQPRRPFFVPTTQECTYSYSQLSTSQSAMASESRCQTHLFELYYQNYWVPTADRVQYGNKSRTIETSSIGGQTRTLEYRNYYRPNPATWIISLPFAQYSYDNGAYSSRVLNDYDGVYAGQPTKGQLTRVRSLKNASSSWITQQSMSYDAYGNVKYVYDGLGKRTDTLYDSLFNLYPVRTSNSLGHYEFFRYHHLEDPSYNTADDGPPGLLRDHRGVDSVVTYHFYDNRGRLQRAFNGWSQQGADWNKPSVDYYYYDGADSNNDGKLDSLPWIGTWTKTQDNAYRWQNGGTALYELYDGMGRVVQTQTSDTDYHINSNWTRTGHRILTDIGYNARGEAVWQSNPYRYTATTVSVAGLYVTPNSSVAKTYTKYDALGNAVYAKDPNNDTTETMYGRRSVYTRDASKDVRASYFDAVGQLIAVDEPIANYEDDFRGSAFNSSWQNTSGVSLSNEKLKVTATSSNKYAINNLDSDLDHGVQFTFKATNNASGHLYINDGGWGTSSYRRIGLHFANNVLRAGYYQGSTSEQSVPAREKTLMRIKSDKTYQVILRGAQDTNDYWTIAVWEVGNPSNRAEIRVQRDSSWDTNDWRFVAQMFNGTVEIDDYKEHEFNRTRYEYDALGNLTKVTNPLGHETSMTYSWWGEKLAMDDPDMGNWVYTYNNRSELITQRDNKNQTIHFTYDDIGRLTYKRMNNASGPLLAEYQYDTRGAYSVGKRTFDRSYELTSSSASAIVHARSTFYNSLGQVSRTADYYSSRFGVGTAARNTYFYYTQGGLMDQMKYPDGELVTTQYYWATGQAKGLSGTSVYIQPSTTYNPAGQMTRLNYASGRNVTYSYDNGHRLTQMAASMKNAPIFDYAWYFGQLVQIRERQRNNSFSQYQFFRYDSLGRMNHSWTSSGPGTYNERVYYDALGNITKKGSVDYGYGSPSGINANKPIHAVTHLDYQQKYWYDDNGNMVKRNRNGEPNQQLEWTPENMLQKVSIGGSNVGCCEVIIPPPGNPQPQATPDETSGEDAPSDTTSRAPTTNINFYYDADGQLVLRTVDGMTKTEILGDGLYEREWLGSNAGTPTKRYMFNGQAVAQRSAGGVYFNMNDHLGGVAATFGATGGVTIVRRDAWGKERSKSGTLPVGNYLFTGQRWDELIELFDYNARYYDAEIGRFISADTIIPDETNPQAFSRYTYVYNSPQKYIDPSGHDPKMEDGSDPLDYPQEGNFLSE